MADSHGGGGHGHGPSPAVYLGLGIGLVLSVAILIATVQGRGPFNDPISMPVQRVAYRPAPTFIPVAPTRYEHRSYEPTAQDIAIARSVYKQIGD